MKRPGNINISATKNEIASLAPLGSWTKGHLKRIIVSFLQDTDNDNLSKKHGVRCPKHGKTKQLEGLRHYYSSIPSDAIPIFLEAKNQLGINSKNGYLWTLLVLAKWHGEIQKATEKNPQLPFDLHGKIGHLSREVVDLEKQVTYLQSELSESDELVRTVEKLKARIFFLEDAREDEEKKMQNARTKIALSLLQENPRQDYDDIIRVADSIMSYTADLVDSISTEKKVLPCCQKTKK